MGILRGCSGLLSGFESTGGGPRRHSPVNDSHRAQPGRPRLHSASRLRLKLLALLATSSRFGLLAWDCAAELADIFPVAFSLPAAASVQDFLHFNLRAVQRWHSGACNSVDGQDFMHLMHLTII